jgi:glutamate racemase
VVLGTPSTVSSQAYVNTLLKLGCPTPVVQRACPLFVPLVEENILEGPAADWIARHYLDDLLRADDAVILGCTHYPFLQSLLARLYPGQNWIDAGAALLDDPKVRIVLDQKKPNPDNTGLHLYFTDDTVQESRLKLTFKQLGLPSLVFEVKNVKID